MFEALGLALAGALAFSGMAWLALAMSVHWDQVMRRPAEAARATRRALRWAGCGALAVSLMVCLVADQPSMACLVWTMLMAGSAFSVAMLLSHRPAWLTLLVAGEGKHQP